MKLVIPFGDQNQIAVLPNPGDYHWRRGGDSHMWDPETIANLQIATRTNTEDAYWKFANHANSESTRRATFRGLMDFQEVSEPCDIEEVEAASDIVKRFCTGAMSYGSISAGKPRNTGCGNEPHRGEIKHRRRRRRSHTLVVPTKQRSTISSARPTASNICAPL